MMWQTFVLRWGWSTSEARDSLSLSPCLFQTCWNHVRIIAVLLFPPHHWLLSTLPVSSCQPCSKSMHRFPCHHQETHLAFVWKGLCISKHPKNKVPVCLFFFFFLNNTPGTCEEICGWFSDFRKTRSRRLKININGADSRSVKIRIVRKGLQWEIWADTTGNS